MIVGWRWEACPRPYLIPCCSKEGCGGWGRCALLECLIECLPCVQRPSTVGRSRGDIPSWKADDKPCLHVVHVKRNKTVYTTCVPASHELLQPHLRHRAQLPSINFVMSWVQFIKRRSSGLIIWLKTNTPHSRASAMERKCHVVCDHTSLPWNTARDHHNQVPFRIIFLTTNTWMLPCWWPHVTFPVRTQVPVNGPNLKNPEKGKSHLFPSVLSMWFISSSSLVLVIFNVRAVCCCSHCFSAKSIGPSRMRDRRVELWYDTKILHFV